MTTEPAFDVVVIGGGGAGLAAATTAASSGARVLLVEADRKLGGSTALSGGVVYAACTSLQRSCGIVDDPAAMARYYMAVNQYKLEASLVSRLCHDSAAVFEWLVGLGVGFPEANLYVSGVDGIRRGHRAAGHGAEIAAALEASLVGKPVETAVATRVRHLVRDDAGAVRGINVDGEDVTCRAVILATGGFGANPAMLAEHYPDALRHPDLAWYIGSRQCKGDGIAMGLSAGGELSTRNRGLLLLTPGFAKELEVYMPGWVVFVNHEGRRFIDETVEYSVHAEVIREQTAGECFALFDEAARLAATGKPAPNWSAERLAHFASTGHVRSAPTLEALAEDIGVRADALAETIAGYNRGCAAGRDDAFFKEPQWLKPVATPPFYAARVRPAVICWTGTGLRIDVEARVLDRAGRPIPGLFAAGETTGGMFGPCYAGGGASITNALVFGRVAGRNAAAPS